MADNTNEASVEGQEAQTATTEAATDGATGSDGPSVADQEGRETKSQSARTSPATSFPVVGIGASAGGLESFEQFFTHMPPDNGMAFVIVQHLDPTHQSMLVDLIQRYTRMKVSQVEPNTPLESNHVYIIPPNRDLVLEGGTLKITPPAKPRGHRLPIDRFFRSFAEDQQEHAICIVLSGTGSDGTLGLKAVKAAGGMAMVQDPATARYDGMPYNALTTDLADYVLPPEEMPEHLMQYVEHAFSKPAAAAETLSADAEDAMMRVFSLLRHKTQHDFSQYKKNTIRRRIERRMAVNQVTTLNDFVRLLRQNPMEIEILHRELLISVTNFFRDPEAFNVLEREVIPQIIESLEPGDPIRVWVPGCATGEEAYSIAIAIAEELEHARTEHEVQIFATDIDVAAIEKARAGIYPDSIAADIAPLRLRRYFVREGNTYQINRRIRDMVVFADQSLIKDPPFSKLDLVSCRNVLIYFGSSLQQRVIPLFHYALKPGGFLFLGTSETLGEFSGRFETINRKWKIFRRPLGSTSEHMAQFLTQMRRNVGRDDQPSPALEGHPGSMRELTQRLLLELYAPPAVVVDEEGDILYLYGRTGKYLEPAAGEPGLNVLRMARRGLRAPLTAALRRARSERETVVRENVAVKTNGDETTIRLTVKSLVRPAALQGLYLVSFEPVEPAAQSYPELLIQASTDGSDGQGEDVDDKDRRIAELEHELSSTKEYLQTTVEELETSNEELQSTNEELQSSNEELQSTNEELETSQEELQSVNEELMTVNNELQAKIEALTQAHNDIANLLDSIPVGVVFLDRDLDIARFNPPAQEIINLIDGDIGRPLAHLSSNLKENNLIEDARQVLDTLQRVEREVEAQDGRWYWLRVQPYRTLDNVIDGLVMTFADITDQKEMQAELERHREHLQELVDQRTAELRETIAELNESRERYRVLVETSPDLISRFDRELRHLYVNPAVEKLAGIPQEAYVGKTNEELGQPPELVRFWRQALSEVFDTGEPNAIEFTYPDPEGENHHLHALLVPEIDAGEHVNSVVSIVRDLTEFEATKRALANTTARYKALFEGARNPIIILDHEGGVLMVNQVAAAAFDDTAGHMQDESLAAVAPRLWISIRDQVQAVLDTGEPTRFTREVKMSDDTGWYSFIVQPIEDVTEWRDAVQIIAYDITEMKRAAEQLKRQEEQFRTIVQELPSGAVYRQGDDVRVNKAVEELTGYPQAELASVDAWFEKLYGDEARERMAAHRAYADEGFPELVTIPITTKGGERRWIEFAGVKIDEETDISVMHNVTARYEAAEELERALTEKETLLRELYHRTKNNMQVISSIIEVQARHLDDPQALDIFHETQTRIRSIALVHEKLYESQTLSRVDLCTYIEELTGLLMRSYRVHDGVQIDFDLASTDVVIDIAIPCGLVLNELISNALKHAFPTGREGTICIALGELPDGDLRLVVRDDGVGLPAGLDVRNNDSLGLLTVFQIVEHQLQGTVDMESGAGEGTTWEIRFPSDLYTARV